MIVTRSILIELDNRCVNSLPFIVLMTNVHLHERDMYSYHDTRFNAGMIEIRPNRMSIAKRRVKTPAFFVLSTMSPFRAVNVCNSFNNDRIGQTMC